MDNRPVGRYSSSQSYGVSDSTYVDTASAFGRPHQPSMAVGGSSRSRFSVDSPHERRSTASTPLQPLQNHRLMWTPELAIQEIVDGGNVQVPPPPFQSSSSHLRQPKQYTSGQLDIKSLNSTSTPTTQATVALEFETTSAATRTVDRSLVNDRSFDHDVYESKWQSPYVIEKTPLRSALAKKRPQQGSNSQPLSAYRSRSARGVSDERRTEHNLHESLHVSPIQINLSNIPHNIQVEQPFSTPAPRYLSNDTTLSAVAGHSGGRSDALDDSFQHAAAAAARLTPSMEMKVMRKEIADLRAMLAHETQRSQQLEDDLLLAKGELNNTSVHADVRERECVELNDFVDALQRRCRTLELELSELQCKRETDQRLGQLLVGAGVPITNSITQTADLGNNANLALLKKENNEIAARLAQANLENAQMKAVLDRLELHAPYPAELVGSARKLLRNFVPLR